MRPFNVYDLPTIAWVDMTGVKNVGGKRSRAHRPDTSPSAAGRTSCGVEIPRLGRPLFATTFEITFEESTGYCLRCYPYTCRRCKRRRGEQCCTSHRTLLCHGCYRRTHFVEVCSEGCEKCATEGLPRIFVHKREEVLHAGAT
jgi:hypothetical protein